MTGGYAYVSAAQYASLNTSTSNVIAEFDSAVALSDADTPFYNRGCVVTNTALNNTTAGTITNITVTANSTDAPISVGTVLTDQGEDMLITACTGSYPNFTISVTRGYNSTTKVAHPQNQPLSDGTIFHTDRIHPNGFGHAIRAQAAYEAVNALVSLGTYQIATSNGNYTQDQRQPFLGLRDNTYL